MQRIVYTKNKFMMRRLTLLIFFALPFFSCKKKEDIIKTFIGNLPIVSSNSPLTSAVGQNIISQVRCQLPSISSSVFFQGFEIKEVSAQQYNITAKALYKDWNTQIALGVLWTHDTTISIHTTVTGKYILNFYNSVQNFKSDTVQVN